jgi:hypothetical protein
VQEIKRICAIYGALGRPLTLIEIYERINKDAITLEELLHFLTHEIRMKRIKEEDGFYWSVDAVTSSVMRREQDLLLDKKWITLTKLSQWFHWIPFVEFICVSGSTSFGNVHDRSDFDVVTGVRKGRMFTTRYLLIALFSLLRARRIDDLGESNANKLCFNHFVTIDTYEKEPHNHYRHELYRNMIPIWAEEEAYRTFVKANAWSGIQEESLLDMHRVCTQKNKYVRYIERILSGKFGDYIEQRIAKPIAMKRLSAYIARKGEGDRVIISDEELEFHFDLNYEKQFAEIK